MAGIALRCRRRFLMSFDMASGPDRLGPNRSVDSSSGGDLNGRNDKGDPSTPRISSQPDITLARKVLKWAPKVNIDKGLPLVLEYFRKLQKHP